MPAGCVVPAFQVVVVVHGLGQFGAHDLLDVHLGQLLLELDGLQLGLRSHYIYEIEFQLLVHALVAAHSECLPAVHQTGEVLRRNQRALGYDFLRYGANKFALHEILGRWTHRLSICLFDYITMDQCPMPIY